MSDQLKIDKGIPVPKKTGPILEVMRMLEVGDSFLISPVQRSGLCRMANLAKIKITSHTEGDRVRVWRIE